MQVYLVRHGESEANIKGLFSGVTNTPLSTKGIEQAVGAGLKLSDNKFDAIYSSPLSRAYETAESIAKFNEIEINIADGLVEMNFGIFEGLTYSQIQETYPEMTEQWQLNPVSFKFPEGESLLDLFNRTMECYQGIISNFKGEKLLIVAHSGVIRSILANEISETFEHYWKYRVDNCKISVIEYSDGYKMLNLLNA